MKRNEASLPSQSAVRPSGYLRLARGLTAWTSNLLASAIVLVLALGGGRQLVRWYQEDAPADHTNGQSIASIPWGEPVSLELVGGGSTLRRETVRGGVEVAMAQLQRFCRGVLTDAAPPSELASQSERRFLASLDEQTPVEKKPGAWSIYSIPGLMPIVVGVREIGPRESISTPTLAEPLRRVLAWGVAVPSGQNDWILYQHQVASDGVARTPEDLPIPIPADCHRTLTITGPGGERTVGIAGIGEAATWQRHFDHQFTRQGWQSRGWQASGGGWHARYESVAAQIAEVHFAGDRPNELRGLVIIRPGNDET